MCLLVPHHRSGLCMMVVKCISLYIWMSDSCFWFMSLVFCVYIQKRCYLTYNPNIVSIFQQSLIFLEVQVVIYILLVLNAFMLFVFLPFLSKPIFFNSWSVYFTFCGPFAITLFYFDCCIFFLIESLLYINYTVYTLSRVLASTTFCLVFQ